MEILNFTPSEPCTVGVELELQLVNTDDYNLTSDAVDLLRRMKDSPFAGNLKPEVTQSMVEINSSVHHRHAGLLAELGEMRDALAQQAKRMNIGISGGGAHPFQKWSERRIYPYERFQTVSEQYGYLAKQFTVFGQHIHIGCASGDDAIYLCHALARFMPHFIALSASSPFYQGTDTAFDSSRLSIVNAFPLSGTLPFVRGWAEFSAYFGRMAGFGIVRSMKDFYWDIRPKPEYGTVEIRVCDTPLTVDKAADLAAYAQALSAWLLEERPLEPSPDIYLIYSYNRFQAGRYGLHGNFINPYTHAHGTIAADILQSVERLAPRSQPLQSAEALGRIAASAESGENDAAWIRNAWTQTGSLSDTVRLQADRWMSRQ